MIFTWILIGIVVLMGLVALINWWRDEQEKLGKRMQRPPGVTTVSIAPGTTLHPSIDPYLAELRDYLLTPPLPQSPGEMGERVYTHLNEWLNTHLTTDSAYIDNNDLEGELLVGPEPRFVNVSSNNAVPTLESLERMTEDR